MKKNRKITLPALVIALIVLIVLKATGAITFRSGTRIGFVGNNTLHKFTGTYAKITGFMSHTLSPSKDSNTLHCEITTKSGSLHVEIILKEDNTVLYDKEISGDENFDLNVSGKVIIKLSTETHSGSYLFQY